MPTLTRRGVLVLAGAGAAGAALTACGTTAEDRRESGDDPGLLEAAAAAEAALGAAYAAAADELDGADADALRQFERASEARASAVRALDPEVAETEEAEAPAEAGLTGAVAAAEGAVAAYREVAGSLSTDDGRSLGMKSIVAVAAELAALRELDGADPAPTAFVTGGSEPPFVAPDSSATDEEDADS